jgi:hypothetical protein
MPRLFASASVSLTVGFLTAATALAQNVPANYSVPDTTLSPDHAYGVTVPQADHYDDIPNPQNQLVEVKTGRVLATIKADAGWDRGNYDSVLPPTWSPDGSLLLWHVDGKWSPTALVLINIQNGVVKWQLDLLKAAQQAILAQTKKAQPAKYAAAKKENSGNGSAYPDGFTVDVAALIPSNQPLALPLKVQANLTSNPKQDEGMTDLDATITGSVDKNGKFTVTKFQIITPDQYEKNEEAMNPPPALSQ